jgi:hypothetical protein
MLPETEKLAPSAAPVERLESPEEQLLSLTAQRRFKEATVMVVN